MVNPLTVQVRIQFLQRVCSNEEDGLAEIPNSFALDETWVLVNLAILPNPVAENETVQTTALGTISAVHIPSYDEPLHRVSTLTASPLDRW